MVFFNDSHTRPNAERLVGFDMDLGSSALELSHYIHMKLCAGAEGANTVVANTGCTARARGCGWYTPGAGCGASSDGEQSFTE
jgi:hypothetical protein